MVNQIQITEVQTVTPELIDELSTLLLDVVAEGASIGFLPPVRQDVANEYWQHLLRPGIMLWIARIDQKLCGTIQLYLAMQQNGTHRAEIAKLMVHPSSRRNGIARILMNEAESRARAEGRSLMVLDTRAGDPSNLLYKSLGYREAGRIPKYARSANGELDETVFYYKQI